MILKYHLKIMICGKTPNLKFYPNLGDIKSIITKGPSGKGKTVVQLLNFFIAYLDWQQLTKRVVLAQ